MCGTREVITVTKRIARPARAMVLLALLGVLLKTGTGCSGENPVYSIEIEKVPSPPVGLPATGRLPTLPHAPEPSVSAALPRSPRMSGDAWDWVTNFYVPDEKLSPASLKGSPSDSSRL